MCSGQVFYKRGEAIYEISITVQRCTVILILERESCGDVSTMFGDGENYLLCISDRFISRYISGVQDSPPQWPERGRD